MRTCRKCKADKPVSEFTRDRRRPDGLMARCKDCRRLECKDWRKSKPDYEKTRYWSDPASHRERHLKRKYGVDLPTYSKMLSHQNGCCAICGKEGQSSKALDVDHCHTTKVVRGLLCTNCNRMIGHAGDSPERLRKAADYLELFRKSRIKSSKASSK